jgi:predicted SAM-dependent methyltransferase
LLTTTKPNTQNTIRMSSTLRLHVGCGPRRLPGFVHVDVQKKNHQHIDVECDVLRLDAAFDANSADEIYACHCLEHVPRHSIDAFFGACYRALKPGGTLRLAVPDMEAVMKLYASGEAPLYPTLYGLIWGGQRDRYDAHTCGFDFRTLQHFASRNGFDGMARYSWREFLPKDSDYDDYSRAHVPHMDADNGTLVSLNVTCKKMAPILVFCTGGFANAIDSVIAAMLFARENKLRVFVHWVEGYTALGARLTDIFDVDADAVTLVDQDEFSRMLRESKRALKLTHNASLSHIQAVPGPVIDPRKGNTVIDLEKIDLVFYHVDALPRHVLESSDDYLDAFFQHFRFKTEISKRADDFVREHRPTTGLHLRGTDSLEQHGNVSVRDPLDYAEQVAAASDGPSAPVLVCTDDRVIYNALRTDGRFVLYDHADYVEKRDGGLSWFHDDGTDHINCATLVHDGREYKRYSSSNVVRTRDQVIAGVIDLLMMARMVKLEGFRTSSGSTYFTLARLLNQYYQKTNLKL